MFLSRLRNRDYKAALTARLDGSLPDAAVPPGGKTESQFNEAMFSVMGKLAKLDGRVTRNEIQYASTIMELMGLREAKKQQAIDSFNSGKRKLTDVGKIVRDLAKSLGKRSALANLFLKIQCRAAVSKGHMNLQEKILLQSVGEKLGYNRLEFELIARDMKSFVAVKKVKTGIALTNSYELLQVESDAEDIEVKKSYLRLMSRSHPDKYSNKNVTDQEMQSQLQKSLDIKFAYDTICQARRERDH